MMPSEHEPSGASRLWWWVCFSAGLHVVLIGSLFLVPPSTAKRSLSYPVYTVDLVGGAGAEVAAPTVAEISPGAPPPPAAREPAVEQLSEEPEVDEGPDDATAETALPEMSAPDPPPLTPPEQPQATGKAAEPVREAEDVAQPEPKPEVEAAPVKQAEKTEKKKAEAPPEPKVVKQEVQKPARKTAKAKEKKIEKKARRKPAKKVKKSRRTEREVAKADEAAIERLRAKRIQAAIAKVRQRAQTQRSGSSGSASDSQQPAGWPGAGHGRGAGLGDGVGNGGGIVRSLEFVIYRNRMLDQIKNSWIWVGKRHDLEVTVRFGVDSTGEVFALQIVGASGDVSYDESVIRAVRRASPLPPPPANYLRDFSDVELTFRPKDLSG